MTPLGFVLICGEKAPTHRRSIKLYYNKGLFYFFLVRFLDGGNLWARIRGYIHIVYCMCVRVRDFTTAQATWCMRFFFPSDGWLPLLFFDLPSNRQICYIRSHLSRNKCESAINSHMCAKVCVSERSLDFHWRELNEISLRLLCRTRLCSIYIAAEQKSLS